MEYIQEVQWKHLYLAYWFAGNGLAPTINMYCDLNAILTYTAMDEKIQFAMSEMKGTQKNVKICFICINHIYLN